MAAEVEMEANKDAAILLKVFKQFDSDNSGTIDREELACAMKMVTVDFSDEQVEQLLIKLDRNGDGVLDYVEFVDWVTDRSCEFSMDRDGWLGHFDLASALKPMFQCFDTNGDGSISPEEFLECYLTLKNCLSMTLGLKSGPLECHPDEAWKTVDVDGDEKVSFAEFLKWQKQLLQRSGIANAQIPALLAELAEHLDVIFSIDRMHRQHIGHDGAEATHALRAEIKKVSSISARLYHAQEDIDMHGPPLTKEKLWQSFVHHPSVDSMKLLVRQCCKDHGILLPMMQLDCFSGQESQPKRKSSISNTSRFPRRRSSQRKKLTLAVGEVTLCIPELQQNNFSFELKRGQLCWLAEVVRSQVGGQRQTLYYELRGNSNWVPLEDQRRFDLTLQALPEDYILGAMLNAYAYMTDKLSWFAIHQALTTAFQKKLVSADAIQRFDSEMRKQTQDHMLRLDLHHDALEAGHTLAEAVSEHLESMIFSPAECMGFLSVFLASAGSPVIGSSTCSTDAASEED